MSSTIKEFYNTTASLPWPIPENFKDWPDTWLKPEHKLYPRFPIHPLLNDDRCRNIEDVSLVQTLKKRKSAVKFRATQQLDFADISTLVKSALSIRHTDQKESRQYQAPGALFSIEHYLVVQDTMDPLPSPGLFHIDVANNGLRHLPFISKDDIGLLTKNVTRTHGKPSCIILQTCVYERLTVKYGDRGYRFALLEAGHAMHNISLVAAALDIEHCEIGLLCPNDHMVNECLAAADNEQYVHAMALGGVLR